MVLETLEQHIKHKIMPARSREKLYKEYMANQKSIDDAENSRVNSKLSRVNSMWSGLVAWYEKDFSAVLKSKVEQREREKQSSGMQKLSQEQFELDVKF